ncbi:MAG TPA: ThiF family adenylyltransferase [Anaerolineae bacterium]|nr:ThiF family adenylyltransferase [Anaerolineae bacterium]
MEYEKLFQRNLGIFEPEEQERIRDASVLIIGCGGIGGVVATVLARSGVGHFALMDPDPYEPSNMNRQVTCFTDTMGKNKAVVTREAILKINPEAEVTVHQRALVPAEIEEVAKLADIIMPAADDWALSLMVLRGAKKLGKPAVMAYPVGALGRTCTFLPDSPISAEECLAMPFGLPYDELEEYMKRPEARQVLQYYMTEGAWREEWFDRWAEGELPHAQICTVVWITACLAAMEILKLITGKWKLVAAPYYWHITPTTARIKKFGLFRRLISRLSRRRWVQQRLPWLARRKRLLRLFTRMIR